MKILAGYCVTNDNESSKVESFRGTLTYDLQDHNVGSGSTVTVTKKTNLS